MLRKPVLARCDDRNVLPRRNAKYGSPEGWFDHSTLSENGLIGHSFDFFVDWGSPSFDVNSNLWIKLLVDEPGELSDRDFSTKLVTFVGADYLYRLLRFADNFEFLVNYIVIPDSQDFSDKSAKIGIVSTRLENDEIRTSLETVNIADFQARITAFSGGPISIGTKGLSYSTSNLECFLSGTSSLYPGDLDLLVCDEQNRPKLIFEFKKHNLSSDINLQQLKNYYPHPDRRKYDRIKLFQHRLGADIPIVILYYPTHPTFTNGIVEVITGEVGNLKTRKRNQFPLANSATDLITRIIRYANS